MSWRWQISLEIYSPGAQDSKKWLVGYCAGTYVGLRAQNRKLANRCDGPKMLKIGDFSKKIEKIDLDFLKVCSFYINGWFLVKFFFVRKRGIRSFKNVKLTQDPQKSS